MSTIDIRRAAQYATVAENAAAQCVIVADSLQANVEGLTEQATAAAQQAVVSQNAAKASETAAKSSETSASASAASAAQSAAEAASSAAATGYVAPPFPDVWAPLSDDLKMISGYPVNTKLLSFTRASTATYIDKSGVLQTAAINEARFEKQGLLIEGPGTNYIAPSNNGWVGYNLAVVAGSGIAPDGTNTAIKVNITDVTSAQKDVRLPITTLAPFIPGAYHTASVFMKAGERSLVQIVWPGGATGLSDAFANFDLTNGTVNKGACYSASIQSLSNGWYRCTATTLIDGSMTTTAASFSGVWVAAIDSLNNGRRPSITGVAGEGFYVWGGQAEASPIPTSYIPTTTAAATRAADDCSAQRSGNDNYFGPVTIAAEVHCNGQTATDGATSSRRGILAAYPTTNDNIILMVDSSSSTAGKYAFAYGSATFNYSDNRIDDGQIHTVCSRSTTSQNQSCVDGTLLTSPTSVSRPTPGTTSSVNQLFYIGRGAGATASGSRMLNGHIRNLRIWHRALSDIQMKGIR